ncbi:MAG: hypothetical protein R3C03_17575 [Pirellulaceae bacterium]
MNHSFYKQILTVDSSQIFDDQDNVVWIDWGDEEHAIVDAIRNHIGVPELNATTKDANKDLGYLVRVCLGEKSIVVDPSNEFDSRHATINAIDELLPDHEIRFVTATNWKRYNRPGS